LFLLLIIGIHEAGHYLAWQAFAIPTKLQLTFTGIRQKPLIKDPSLPLPAKIITCCALAGPLASLTFSVFLFAITYLTEGKIKDIALSLQQLNYLWIFYQLMPIYPLDGWYIFKGLSQLCLGVRGLQMAYFLNFFLWIMLTATSFLINIPSAWLLISLCGFLNYQAWSHFKKSLLLGSSDFQRPIYDQFQRIMNLKSIHPSKAQDQLKSFIHTYPKGQFSDRARIELAFILSQKTEFEAAYTILCQIENRLQDDAFLLLHSLAYQNHDFNKVQQLSAKAYEHKKDASICIINAIACSKIFEKKPSSYLIQATLGWLTAAKDLRFNHWSILESSDFKQISLEESFIKGCRALRS
jgi:hypothetical protein